jgi:hypothetical protein
MRMSLPEALVLMMGCKAGKTVFRLVDALMH